jgi:hypothetical protein
MDDYKRSAQSLSDAQAGMHYIQCMTPSAIDRKCQDHVARGEHSKDAIFKAHEPAKHYSEVELEDRQTLGNEWKWGLARMQCGARTYSADTRGCSEERDG